MNNWRGLVTDADVIANGLANFQNNIIAMDLTTVWVAPYAGAALAAENAATGTFLNVASRTNTIITTPCDVLVNAWSFTNPDYRPNGTGSGAALAGADLTSGIQVETALFAPSQTGDFVVDLFENAAGNTNGTITVTIPVPPAFTITVPGITLSATPQSGTNGNATALSVPYFNGDWLFSLVGSNLVATSKVGVIIPLGGSTTLGYRIQRKATTPGGTNQNLSVSVSGGSDSTPGNNDALQGLGAN